MWDLLLFKAYLYIMLNDCANVLKLKFLPSKT